MPTIVEVFCVGTNGLLHSGFHTFAVVDELCTVFEDEVVWVGADEGAVDGETATRQAVELVVFL